MVSSMLVDALTKPLTMLYSLKESHDSRESSTEFSVRVSTQFRSIFNSEHAFKQIPVLDVLHPPQYYRHHPHSLVRFRAMVQDTSFSPEMYPLTLLNGRPGGWGLAEISESDTPMEIQNIKEREVVWAVSVPGESPFVSEYLDEPEPPAMKCTLQDTSSNIFRHKDPLLRENHLGAQIKVYDTSSLPIRPTELRTFVGFLTFEHAPSIENIKNEDPLLPTLHTIFSIEHPLSLVQFSDPSSPAEYSVEEKELPIVPASTVRDELIQWISDEALGGDLDAAEWVLLASIARVQSRQPPLFPPSLTISRFPTPIADSATATLVHVLRHILPLLVDIPLSLQLVNTRPFFPQSSDENLRSGLLQLPPGTVVIASDNGINEGVITEEGVRNIHALRTSLLAQTLDYQFPFSAPYQFPTDLTYLILTEGKNSPFVETQLNIPLERKYSSDCFKRPEDIQLPPPSELEAFRRLVGGAKTGTVGITDEISQYIQDDFVRERQTNKEVTAEDLATRMSVARLMALSQHGSHLSKEMWHRAKKLDERRKKRS